MDELLTATASPIPAVRRRIAWILGEAADPRAYPALVALTRDPVRAVRYDAAVALGNLGDERAVTPLIALMVEQDPVGGLDNAAAMGLERLGRPAVSPLLTLLESPDARVRSIAARVLGGIGEPAACQPLEHLLRDENEDTRIAAIEALAEIGGAPCLELLESRLLDASPRVRQHAQYWGDQVRRTFAEAAHAERRAR